LFSTGQNIANGSRLSQVFPHHQLIEYPAEINGGHQEFFALTTDLGDLNPVFPPLKGGASFFIISVDILTQFSDFIRQNHCLFDTPKNPQTRKPFYLKALTRLWKPSQKWHKFCSLTYCFSKFCY